MGVIELTIRSGTPSLIVVIWRSMVSPSVDTISPLKIIVCCIDWIRIATEIELNYATFDAFVVLHGTDTMSYTSSALGFLLEDLGKTVVRTLQIVSQCGGPSTRSD